MRSLPSKRGILRRVAPATTLDMAHSRSRRGGTSPRRATPAQPARALRPSTRGPPHDPDALQTLEEAPSGSAGAKTTLHIGSSRLPPIRKIPRRGTTRIPRERSDPRRGARRTIPMRSRPSKRRLRGPRVPETTLRIGSLRVPPIPKLPRPATSPHPAGALRASPRRPALSPDPRPTLEEAPSASARPKTTLHIGSLRSPPIRKVPRRGTRPHPNRALRASPRRPALSPDPRPTLEEAPSSPGAPETNLPEGHWRSAGASGSFGEPPARLLPERSDPRREVRRAFAIRAEAQPARALALVRRPDDRSELEAQLGALGCAGWQRRLARIAQAIVSSTRRRIPRERAPPWRRGPRASRSRRGLAIARCGSSRSPSQPSSRTPCTFPSRALRRWEHDGRPVAWRWR